MTIAGKTYAKAKVKLENVATGAIEQTVKASTKGQFQFTFTVGFGSTTVLLAATAPGHKATSTQLTVNRIDNVPPVINLQALSAGSLTRTEETIAGNVSDVAAGVTALTAVVNGGQTVVVPFDSAGNFSYTTTLPLNGSADGLNTVQFVATDGCRWPTRSAVGKLHARHSAADHQGVGGGERGVRDRQRFVVSGQVSDAVSGPSGPTAAADRVGPSPSPCWPTAASRSPPRCSNT